MEIRRVSISLPLLAAVIWIGVLNLGFARSAFARPVSWLGGWSLMVEGRPDQSDWMLSQTALPNFSFGAHYSRTRGSGRDATVWLGQISWLARRWLENDAQANLYLTTEGREGGPRPIFLRISPAVETDWETRRFYLSARGETVMSPGHEPLRRLQARAGFAPYLAQFEGLHTWFIVQGDVRDHHSEVRVTPMLRFLYQNVLWEIGSSLNEGDTLLSMVIEI